ncbi:hypothetical protein COB52_05550, partial [Candidatus Kaiserbacteria bacterium]
FIGTLDHTTSLNLTLESFNKINQSEDATSIFEGSVMDEEDSFLFANGPDAAGDGGGGKKKNKKKSKK